MDKITKTNRIKVLIIFLILFISASIFTGFYIYKLKTTKYIKLFFTDYEKKALIIEKRKFFYKKSLRNNIKNVLKELCYGPIKHNLDPLLSHNADVKDVWVVNNFAYINLADKTIQNIPTADLAVKSLIRTIFTNFPKIKKIKFLIEGENIPSITGIESLNLIYYR